MYGRLEHQRERNIASLSDQFQMELHGHMEFDRLGDVRSRKRIRSVSAVVPKARAWKCGRRRHIGVTHRKLALRLGPTRRPRRKPFSVCIPSSGYRCSDFSLATPLVEHDGSRRLYKVAALHLRATCADWTRPGTPHLGFVAEKRHNERLRQMDRCLHRSGGK